MVFFVMKLSLKKIHDRFQPVFFSNNNVYKDLFQLALSWKYIYNIRCEDMHS